MHLTTVNEKEEIDIKEIRDSYMESYGERKKEKINDVTVV